MKKSFHRSSILLTSLVSISCGTLSTFPAFAFTPAEADRIMTQELRVKIVGCAIPGVTRIQIGEVESCTLDIPGQKRFLYDAGTKKLFDVTDGSTAVPVVNTVPPTNTPTPTTPQKPSNLNYGDVYDGTITAQSTPQQATTGFFGQVEVRGPGDDFTFQANAGDQVTIQVTPKGGLATFLSLRGPAGNQVAESNKTINTTITNAGVYKIIVIGDKGTLGSYSLSLSSPNGTNTTSSNSSSDNSGFSKRFRTSFTGLDGCMGVLGGKVVMTRCSSTPALNVQPSRTPGYSFIQIPQTTSGGTQQVACLEVDPSSKALRAGACANNNPAQLWSIEDSPSNPGYSNLKSRFYKAGNYCLDVGNTRQANKPVLVRPCTPSSGQDWQIADQ